MIRKPTVCILLSTYNGEKYLREQLDSIFAQEEVEIKLVVRDDGSTDDTVKILNSYKDIYLIKGENIGCIESFKQHLYMPNEADYFAFADQDDVWHPRKLISAIENMRMQNADLSVCNLMITDDNMNIQRPMFNTKDIELISHRFRTFVISNIHGCTQVWTKKLHIIIQSYYPPVTFTHDIWVNAVANMVSTTVIDPKCYINYRIHGNNTGGLAKNTYQRIRKGLERYVIPKHPTKDILCMQLLEGYGKYLDPIDDRFKLLLMISNYRNSFSAKLKLFFSNIVTQTDFQHRCLYWICILINKY